MATIDVPEDFREFLSSLNEAKVRYLLIGGFAVSIHGYPRATGDLDVWVAGSQINGVRIVQALRHFGFQGELLTSALFRKRDQIVRMGVPPLRIEILTTIAGVTFSDCYRRRVMTDVGGVKVPVIGLLDLKVNKRASGRAKDINDLQNLP